MLRALHLWVGLAAAVFILIQAVTGIALLFKGPLVRVEHETLAAHGAIPTGPAVARAIAALQGAAWTSVRLPSDDMPGIEVALASGERLLFDAEGKGPRSPSIDGEPSVAHWLHEVHVSLAAGASGEAVAGVAGIALLFLGLSGLVVWWPLRRRSRVHDLVPRGTSRPKLLRWHSTAGMLASLGVVGLSATGIMLGFNGVPHRVAMGLVGADYGAGTVSAITVPVREVLLPANIDWPGVIAAADAAFPDDTLGLLSAPSRPDRPVIFRTHRDGEWNPIGRSLIAVDPTSATVVGTWDALAAGRGTQVMMSLFPLHAGKAGGSLYTAAVLLAGLVIVGLSVSGVFAYLRRARQQATRVLLSAESRKAGDVVSRPDPVADPR